MAMRHCRRQWQQLQYRKHVTSLVSFLLHTTQRFYGSACRNYVIPSQRRSQSWRRLLQNLFLFLAAGFLLLLLSAGSAPDVASNLDPEIIQYMQVLGGKDLCIDELRGPLKFVQGLDVEIGLIVNGTMLFRFSPTEVKPQTETEITFADISVHEKDSTEAERTREKMSGGNDVSLHSTGHLESSVLSAQRQAVLQSDKISENLNNENVDLLRAHIHPKHLSQYIARKDEESMQYRDQFSKEKSYQVPVKKRSKRLKRTRHQRADFRQRNVGSSKSSDDADPVPKGGQISQTFAKLGDENKSGRMPDLFSSSNMADHHFDPKPPSDDFLVKPSKSRVSGDLEVTSRSWEPIAGAYNNIFVYSAFYDDRRGRGKELLNRRVSVLGLSVYHPLMEYPHLKRQVFCHFRWRESPELHVSQRGVIQSIREDHNLTYHAIFILCDLHLCANPDYVGVTVDRSVLPQSYLRIQYPPAGRQHRYNITTCFPVMHSAYDNTAEFLQVMETSRILGSQKFTLYVNDASPEVMRIIRYYVKSGIMEAIDWKLPTKNLSDVHYFGQMAAVNDCLYQSMYRSRHVLFHDFDEILFPRLHDTYSNMLEEFRLQSESLWERLRRLYGKKQDGTYTFLNVFFPKNWTHPGPPGSVVIEGSNSTVDPESVDLFLYGFKDKKTAPDKTGEGAKDQSGGNGGNRADTEGKLQEDNAEMKQKGGAENKEQDRKARNSQQRRDEETGQELEDEAENRQQEGAAGKSRQGDEIEDKHQEGKDGNFQQEDNAEKQQQEKLKAEDSRVRDDEQQKRGETLLHGGGQRKLLEVGGRNIAQTENEDGSQGVKMNPLRHPVPSTELSGGRSAPSTQLGGGRSGPQWVGTGKDYKETLAKQEQTEKRVNLVQQQEHKRRTELGQHVGQNNVPSITGQHSDSAYMGHRTQPTGLKHPQISDRSNVQRKSQEEKALNTSEKRTEKNSARTVRNVQAGVSDSKLIFVPEQSQKHSIQTGERTHQEAQAPRYTPPKKEGIPQAVKDANGDLLNDVRGNALNNARGSVLNGMRGDLVNNAHFSVSDNAQNAVLKNAHNSVPNNVHSSVQNNAQKVQNGTQSVQTTSRQNSLSERDQPPRLAEDTGNIPRNKPSTEEQYPKQVRDTETLPGNELSASAQHPKQTESMLRSSLSTQDLYPPALRLTWRENLVWASQWRSKMLVRPEAVLMMGVHNVHLILPGFRNRDLTADEALVHHYRNWWVKKGTVMVNDTTALRLENLLLAGIERTLKALEDEN